MPEIPVALPEGMKSYARTPDFTDANLPEKLQSVHSTKAGTWGLLHVLAGTVRYVLEAPGDAEVTASAGEKIVIESGVPHRVCFVTPGRLFIEFYRLEPHD